jgi:hypothetical protein
VHRVGKTSRDLARRRVFHINKEGFLPAFRDAFFDVLAETNCQKAFEASGLVPINAQVVLDRLGVRLRTPPVSPLTSSTRKRDTKSTLLRLFRSTTSYDNAITLALVCTILDTFLFLVLDLGSYSPYRSSLFRLPF